jgi:hypothetical protein
MQKSTMLVLVLACGVAQAADWVSFAKRDDLPSEMFIDNSSIHINGEIRSARTKTIYAPHALRVPDSENKWVKESQSRESFNCTEETFRTNSLSAYFYDGTNSSAPAEVAPTKWLPVPPDTVLKHLMHYVCAWTPK